MSFTRSFLRMTLQSHNIFLYKTRCYGKSIPVKISISREGINSISRLHHFLGVATVNAKLPKTSLTAKIKSQWERTAGQVGQNFFCRKKNRVMSFFHFFFFLRFRKNLCRGAMSVAGGVTTP